MAAVKVADRAREAFRQGWHFQMVGQFDKAVVWYRKSLELSPTAEAHNFLGWAYSCQGLYEEAIRECMAAVALDPDYGNPCNDIGAYLIELGRGGEAIPWLKKACRARRYDCKHYAHFNLGRAYEASGRWDEAMKEYRFAFEALPGYDLAKNAFARLVARTN